MSSFEAAASYWCPIAGVLTSNALFCAPFAAVLERVNAGSLGKLNPLPVAITVLSSGAWLQYGLSVPDAYIVAGNLPALTAAIFGFLLMLPLMNESPELRRVQVIFVSGCFATFCLWTYLIFAHRDSEARSSALGSWASAIFVVLASSPLTTMRTVVATRDASSIYAPMTGAQCVNCALWTVYGLAAAHDVFVWGPNLTGLLLGLMQLALKLAYRSKAPEAHEEKKSVLRNPVRDEVL